MTHDPDEEGEVETCEHRRWGEGAVTLTTAMQYNEYEGFPSPYGSGDIQAQYCLDCGVIRIPPEVLAALQDIRGFEEVQDAS